MAEKFLKKLASIYQANTATTSHLVNNHGLATEVKDATAAQVSAFLKGESRERETPNPAQVIKRIQLVGTDDIPFNEETIELFGGEKIPPEEITSQGKDRITTGFVRRRR